MAVAKNEFVHCVCYKNTADLSTTVFPFSTKEKYYNFGWKTFLKITCLFVVLLQTKISIFCIKKDTNHRSTLTEIIIIKCSV